MDIALNVPGLREMSLRIEIGDIVQLRQLCFEQTSKKYHNDRQLELGSAPYIQNDGVVWGINRFNETLSLRVDGLAPVSMLFNARFTIQRSRIEAMWTATMAAQHSLSQSNEGWLRSVLFPDASDGRQQTNLNKASVVLDQYDHMLNYEQLRAVDNILNAAYGLIPYIISGPPGTGKTKTMVELALQLLRKDETSHLLMCAPSDQAADTLVQRLSKHLQLGQMLRLNASSRNFPEVPNSILPYCYIDVDMFALPPFEQLMRVQVIVTTCRDADMLLKAHVSNATLFELERSMRLAIHPKGDHMVETLHWRGLLMDEAAQANELEALIPLHVVAPPNGQHLPEQNLPIFVMAGDQCQLGPRTASKTTVLQKSLFERILERPIYSEHPLARSKQKSGTILPLTREMLPILRPPFTNLIRNYRSHPAIIAVPSHSFYSDTLEPEAIETDSLRSVPVWKGREWPVVFISHDNPDEIEHDGGGWYNVQEAKIASMYARSFLESGLIRAEEICIMSPFRAQVSLLRRMSRQAPFSMPAVNIGPLEAFQGLESRLVILCTTRTRDRFLEQDLAKGLGVIHEPRRFNVALTRAKHGLVVIGNPAVLEKDRHWSTFMTFCHRNGLWDERRREEWKPSSDVTTMPRLEKQLLQAELDLENSREHQEHLANGIRKLGIADDDETMLWRSGIEAAEQVLQEDVESTTDVNEEEHLSG